MELCSDSMRVVKTLLNRCVDVVDLLAARPGPSRLSDIAGALGLPKSAAHRLLRELCMLGWVEQDRADGPYRLTLRFGLLGQRVMLATGLLDLTRPLLERLAAETRELARLTIVTGAGVTGAGVTGSGVTGSGLAWLSSAQGAPPGLMYQPAMDGPVVLHATANGKAWLAAMPDDQALDLARRGGLGQAMPTSRTMTEETALLADLAGVRARGYAVADQEAELGVTAVAVALPDRRMGTVSVAGPSARLAEERFDALAAALTSAAAGLAMVWPAHARGPAVVAAATAAGKGPGS